MQYMKQTHCNAIHETNTLQCNTCLKVLACHDRQLLWYVSVMMYDCHGLQKTLLTSYTSRNSLINSKSSSVIVISSFAWPSSVSKVHCFIVFILLVMLLGLRCSAYVALLVLLGTNLFLLITCDRGRCFLCLSVQQVQGFLVCLKTTALVCMILLLFCGAP